MIPVSLFHHREADIFIGDWPSFNFGARLGTSVHLTVSTLIQTNKTNKNTYDLILVFSSLWNMQMISKTTQSAVKMEVLLEHILKVLLCSWQGDYKSTWLRSFKRDTLHPWSLKRLQKVNKIIVFFANYPMFSWLRNLKMKS